MWTSSSLWLLEIINVVICYLLFKTKRFRLGSKAEIWVLTWITSPKFRTASKRKYWSQSESRYEQDSGLRLEPLSRVQPRSRQSGLGLGPRLEGLLSFDTTDSNPSSLVCYLLAVPRFRLNSYGRRAFSVAGPMAWNSLPDFIRDPTSSTDCFRRLIKT